MKRKLKKVMEIFGLLLIASIVVFSLYMKSTYSNVPFEELYFYIFNGVTNSDSGVFTSAIIQSLPYVIVLFILLFVIFFDITRGKKKFKLYPIKFINKHRGLIIIITLVLSIIFGLYNLNLFSFIKNANTDSNFIEFNYTNSKDVNIEFEKKKNLIFIISESLETSMFTKKQGGYWDYDVTPELYKLLEEEGSTTFYNKNKAQGLKMISGASYTTASVFANTSGLPFKIPIEGNSYHSKNFMNGAYTLGDLLKDNGYHNELISSARTSFGGIKEYFTKHGNYSILDVDSVKDYGLKINDNDLGAWGLNDNYLFKTAKKRLSDLSKKDEPFNMTLLSIDSHFPDGLVGDYTSKKYKTQYENVYATESKLIYDFVSWVKKQDFYEDTTIVIVGDHLSMQSDYFTLHGAKRRYVYNCIINSYVTTENNSNREFSALDTFPTIVSSIGGNIKGDKLGLGINLFSDKKTMLERYSFGYVNDELLKKSSFYDKTIIDDDYINNIKKNNYDVEEKIAIIK